MYQSKSRHEREGSHRWDFKEHVIKELSTKEWIEIKEPSKGAEEFTYYQYQKVKGITSGAPYIIDKLEQDRQKIENDILTMMGVNNVGIGEKKEHLIVDEVNANNQDIEEQDNAFESQISNDFDRVNKCFSKNIEVIDMNEQYMGEQEPQEEEPNDAEKD